MKNKFYYIGLNLFVPGMGQISAKRYLRGTIQVLAAVGAIFWLAAEVLMPLFDFYSGDPLENKMPEMKLASIIIPILFFFAVLLWSIIDLMFGFNKKNKEN
jgi:TM2 domain-containing membrane protein YozV